MKIADANLLLYAYNESAAHHKRAKEWLEERLSSPEIFGLSWQIITAFLWILITQTTNLTKLSRIENN